MATFKGKDSLKGINLIVRVRENRKAENSRYLEIQRDQSLFNPDKVRAGEKQEAMEKGLIDSNPYLTSKRVDYPGKPGEQYVDHAAHYTTGQYEAMLAAAGDKVVELENGDKIFGIKADLMINKKKEVIVNTKQPMAPTDNKKFGPQTLDLQKAVTEAARDFRKAERAKAKEAVEKEQTVEATAEAQAPEAEADELDVEV